MSTQEKQINWIMAEAVSAGDAALATTLLNMLIQELPNNQVLLYTYYQQRDWENLADLAHKLQGACCYCAVTQLKDCSRKLEIEVRAKQVDSVAIGLALEALNHCITALLIEAATEPRLQALSAHQDHKG